MGVAVNVRTAIERGDLNDFLSALDPEVVWRGTRGELCRNREEVRSVFEGWLARGLSGRPEIIAESDDRIVVDPHVEPAHPEVPELHHVFTLRDGLIVEMQDYPNRETAVAAL